MDRAQLIYAILQKQLGNYRTEHGLKLIQKLQTKTNAELKEILNK